MDASTIPRFQNSPTSEGFGMMKDPEEQDFFPEISGS